MKTQYYLIHGPELDRGKRMRAEFDKWGLHQDRVKWMLWPNGTDISLELYRQLTVAGPSVSCGIPAQPMSPNKVSCTFKHFLCLQDMLESGHDYGVIMEDNQFFCGNIPETVDSYIAELNSRYPGWDIVFDSKWKAYGESPLVPDTRVYPKSNDINKEGHGGTRLAQFYVLTRACAEKLHSHYVPFNHAPDWWMNDLFRKLDIRAFWSEPCISAVYPHVSSV